MRLTYDAPAFYHETRERVYTALALHCDIEDGVIDRKDGLDKVDGSKCRFRDFLESVLKTEKFFPSNEVREAWRRTYEDSDFDWKDEGMLLEYVSKVGE